MAGGNKSLRGSFLLDGGSLAGSFFHRAVVLICRHTPEGAFGLVVNRPTPSHVGEVVEMDLPDLVKGSLLHIGGPVQTSALTYLHTDIYLPSGSILPNLSMGHSMEELVALGGTHSPGKQLRCFAGYSGWSPGQLESELERDAWVIHPASVDQVFQDPPNTLWRDILRQKGPKYRLLAEEPEDPSLN